MEGLTEGRIVHYVLESGSHRPAIIVAIWNRETGLANLQVFTDGLNDSRSCNKTGYSDGLYWATSIRYSEAKEVGTWHWIERA